MSQVLSFTTEEIAAACKKIVTASKSASRAIETVLVMAVYDSIVNKSAVVANTLVGSLRQSMKQDAIVAFLEKFGQLYDRGGKARFAHFALGAQARVVWDADYVALVQEEARNWESFKADPKDSVYDVVKAVEAIIKKADKADEAHVTDKALAEYLKALLAQYTSKKALAAAQATATVAVRDTVAVAA